MDFYYPAKVLHHLLKKQDLESLKLLFTYPKRFKGFSIPYPNGYNRTEIRNQLFEGFVSETYTRSLKFRSSEPVILDLGASYGLIALSLHSFFPKARIYSFEPNPLAYQYAQTLFEQNHISSIELIPKAVGAPGQLKLYVNPDLLETSNSVMAYYDNTQTFEVESIALSSFIQSKNLQRIDFLKMDIEGPEIDVIEDLAAHGMLDRIDNIVLEFHLFKTPHKSNAFQFLSTLHNAGFSLTIRTLTTDSFQTRTMIWANHS